MRPGQSYYDPEDYQFPLPVQDMNNEIISLLDDESLYQLCQTNKQMAKTCLSNNIWTLRANSPLAPLYIVRDQYKNWMDFYANVRKDYLYGTGSGDVYTDIKMAFAELLHRIRSPYITIKPTLDQLVLAAANTDHTHKHKPVSIRLIRKGVIYDRNNPGEHILYSVGMDNNFLNPNILMYPDLVDVPIMILVSDDGKRLMFVDVNGRALTESIFMPGIRKNFYLSFNNRITEALSMGSFGWRIGRVRGPEAELEKGAIVNGATLNIEGIDKDKYHLVLLPHEVDYQGTAFKFDSLSDRPNVDTPEGINNLRWYIDTFGTFFRLENIADFLPKGPRTFI
jgi:hypothetical protein